MPSYLDLNGLQAWDQCLKDQINWCPEIDVESGALDLSASKIFNLVASSDVAVTITGKPKRDMDEFWLAVSVGDCEMYSISWPSNVSFASEPLNKLRCFRKTVFRFCTFDAGSTWSAEVMAEMPYGGYSSWSFNLLVGGSVFKQIGEIPFNLQDAPDTSMLVDWGDGTVEILRYSSTGSSIACPSHIYSMCGTYTVTMESLDFSKLYLRNGHSDCAELYAHRLIKINTPLPPIAGVYNMEDPIQNSFYEAFYGCCYLNSVCDGLFNNNPDATDFSSCFKDCTCLYNVPSNILSSCTSIQTMDNFLCNCVNLKEVDLNIRARNIQGANSFCTGAAGDYTSEERNYTIHVPAESASLTTFETVASSVYFMHVYADETE